LPACEHLDPAHQLLHHPTSKWIVVTRRRTLCLLTCHTLQLSKQNRRSWSSKQVNRIIREINALVWPHKKNGQNKDTKRGITITIFKEFYGMTQNKMF
jgi:hypothetical protein